MTLTQVDLIMTVDFEACQRARRLEFAMRQISAGTLPRDCRRLVMERFKCSRMTAWRIVEMAVDMAEVKA